MVEVDKFYQVYMASPSLRYAAKRLGVDLGKLRLIRDLEGWPKKSRRQLDGSDKAIEIQAVKAASPRYSIYDAIETDKPLTKEQIEECYK